MLMAELQLMLIASSSAQEDLCSGILALPDSPYVLGAAAGVVLIVFWGLANTWMAHPGPVRDGPFLGPHYRG